MIHCLRDVKQRSHGVIWRVPSEWTLSTRASCAIALARRCGGSGTAGVDGCLDSLSEEADRNSVESDDLIARVIERRRVCLDGKYNGSGDGLGLLRVAVGSVESDGIGGVFLVRP